MPSAGVSHTASVFCGANRRLRQEDGTLRLGHGSRPPASRIESFDSVSGVTLTDVELPRRVGGVCASRTIQKHPIPSFGSSVGPPSYPLRVVGIPHGRLATGGGVVFTADGDLVMETLWDQPHFSRDFDPP